MKWQTQPKRGTCWVETDCGTWRVVQSSWPRIPKEPFPYVLFKGAWRKEWDRKKAAQADVWKGALIGGFASLKEAQERASELA